MIESPTTRGRRVRVKKKDIRSGKVIKADLRRQTEKRTGEGIGEGHFSPHVSTSSHFSGLPKPTPFFVLALWGVH